MQINTKLKILSNFCCIEYHYILQVYNNFQRKYFLWFSPPFESVFNFNTYKYVVYLNVIIIVDCNRGFTIPIKFMLEMSVISSNFGKNHSIIVFNTFLSLMNEIVFRFLVNDKSILSAFLLRKVSKVMYFINSRLLPNFNSNSSLRSPFNTTFFK